MVIFHGFFQDFQPTPGDGPLDEERESCGATRRGGGAPPSWTDGDLGSPKNHVMNISDNY